jgi:hypothetical protein
VTGEREMGSSILGVGIISGARNEASLSQGPSGNSGQCQVLQHHITMPYLSLLFTYRTLPSRLRSTPYCPRRPFPNHVCCHSSRLAWSLAPHLYPAWSLSSRAPPTICQLCVKGFLLIFYPECRSKVWFSGPA